MDASGNLNPESSARAAKAAEVFFRTSAQYIVTCGWNYRPDSDLAIADAFSRELQGRHGIPENQILADRSSRDTVGDAIFTKVHLAIPHKWTQLIIVTSDYHVARCSEIFSFIYGEAFRLDVVGAEVNAPPNVQEQERLSLTAFRSTFSGIRPGDDLGILRQLRERHPFYNGDIHPKI